MRRPLLPVLGVDQNAFYGAYTCEPDAFCRRCGQVTLEVYYPASQPDKPLVKVLDAAQVNRTWRNFEPHRKLEASGVSAVGQWSEAKKKSISDCRLPRVQVLLSSLEKRRQSARNDFRESCIMETSALPLGARSNEDIALDLMKFIATATSYGRAGGLGFQGGGAASKPEEYADHLLELYGKCLKAVEKK